MIRKANGEVSSMKQPSQCFAIALFPSVSLNFQERKVQVRWTEAGTSPPSKLEHPETKAK